MLAIALFISILCVVLAIHITYPFLLKRLSRKSISLESESEFKYSLNCAKLPYVTILIPVYNEERDIRVRLDNILESDYPKNKLEIIVIDSGSIDKTRSIIKSQFKNKVILITELQRQGKAHAINLGLQSCNGEIIILTDGTTRYDKTTIIQLVAPFKDIRVGAVSAKYHVPNRQESHISESEYKFWLHKDKIRILESATHSTSWLSGEACAFRNGIISKVDEDALADDSNIALQIISKGYRVIVNQEAYFVERSPTRLFDYMMIKSRRALGGLMETLRFRFLLFNSQHGYFGTIIFPYRIFVCFVSPILTCVLVGLLIPTIMEIVSNFGSLALTIIVIGVIVTVFLVRRSVTTLIYTQLIIIIALFWLVMGNKNVRWTRSKTR